MAFVLNNSNIAFPDGSTQTSTFTDTGTPLQVQVFTTSGYWLKPNGAKTILVKLVGGGGGGAGYCESGAAGGYCEGMLDVTNYLMLLLQLVLGVLLLFIILVQVVELLQVLVHILVPLVAVEQILILNIVVDLAE